MENPFPSAISNLLQECMPWLSIIKVDTHHTNSTFYIEMEYNSRPFTCVVTGEYVTCLSWNNTKAVETVLSNPNFIEEIATFIGQQEGISSLETESTGVHNYSQLDIMQRLHAAGYFG